MLFVNGHNLYVEQTGPGNGPAVVLLHHGLGSVRAWRGQVGVLSEAGFRVVAYDRWGYGRSDERLGLDLPTFAADLADLDALLGLLEIQQATLIGHSDGGTIALYYATMQPERVSCLVTIAAHIYVESKMGPGILGVRHEFETNQRFRMGLKLVHGDKYETVFHNWFDGWYRDEMSHWDMRPILGTISCPVLVIQGEADEHATPQHAMDIANAIPGATLWILPGAGHMLPQENQAEFNTRVIEFLNHHVAVER